MAITLHQMLDAVETTLDDATGIVRSFQFDQLPEGLNSGDLPALLVHPGPMDTVDSASGQTDRKTFQAGVRQEIYTIYADFYCRQRSHLGEDMASVVLITDAVVNVLEAETSCPFFDLEGVKNFQWSAAPTLFEYAGAEYWGVRFSVRLRVF